MILELLISASNEGVYNFYKNLLNPLENVKYLISHQIFDNKDYSIKINRNDVLYKKSYSKGLARNRNAALLYATGDICLIADDDVSYSKGYFDNIIKAFKENPDADIITFKAKTNLFEPEFKKYPNFAFWHNIKSIFKVSSIEIAFKLKSIKTNGLKFDENFGLGSMFTSGEEIIFLMDAFKKGLGIKFIPYYIVNHPYERSGTKSKYINEKIIASGAIFYRMFGLGCILFTIYSVFYNYVEYRAQKSLLQYLKLSLHGSLLAFRILNHKWKHSIMYLLRFFIDFMKKSLVFNKK